jgi:hypothetical protein
MDDKVIPDPKVERLRIIFEMVQQDKSYEEIGEFVGLSRQRVSQICLEHGIVRRPLDVNKERWKEFWEKRPIHKTGCSYRHSGICTCGPEPINLLGEEIPLRKIG